MIDVLDKDRQVLDPALKEIVDDAESPEGGYVICGVCSHVVARQSDRIETNGSHAHEFTNPYGFRFRVGCFADALGCSISGEGVAADTWFPGFRWRLASCEDCRCHLGWYFDNPDSYFYGLRLDQVIND